MPQHSKKHLEKSDAEKKAKQKTLSHLAWQLAGLGTHQNTPNASSEADRKSPVPVEIPPLPLKAPALGPDTPGMSQGAEG